mmetsp:Transcript_32251/g.78672  ORF Transcript_32251/g.78672 Transcript_32251/m.78672 type:complete len:334 (+) Transcript_32251:80-1081(+)
MANTPLLSSGIALTTVAIGSAILWTTSNLEFRVKAAEAEGKLLAEIEHRESKVEKQLKKLEEQLTKLKSRETKLATELEKLEKIQKDLDEKETVLETKENDLKAREDKLVKDSVSLEEFKSKLELNEKELIAKAETLQTQEDELQKKEEDLRAKELSFLEQRESAIADTATAVDATPDEPVTMTEDDDDDDDDDKDDEKNKVSEKEMRIKMIEEELQRWVKEAEERELEEPFDDDSLTALKTGAMKVCYIKKYYDCMVDKIIYFPSVQSSIVNYTLIEEAEKQYFDEEDEYPMDLTVALRTVATEAMAEDGDDAGGDDVDEEYMASLAQDVEI